MSRIIPRWLVAVRIAATPLVAIGFLLYWPGFAIRYGWAWAKDVCDERALHYKDLYQ